MAIKAKLAFKAIAMAACVLASTCVVWSQEVAQMGTADLKTEVTDFIKGKRYVEARPYLKELIVRLESSEDKELRKELAQMYYFYAYGFFLEFVDDRTKVDMLKSAVENFDKLIAQFPQTEFALNAVKSKAEAYLAAGKFDEAAKAREILLKPPFSERLNNSQQAEIIRQISEAYYYNQKWDNAKPWFELLFKRASNLDEKVFAASGMIQYMAAKKQMAELDQYLPYMTYNVAPRYDVFLNLAFLNVGDQLYKEKKMDKAALIFSLVFSRETIVNYFTEYVAQLKAEVERYQSRNPNDHRLIPLQKRLSLMELELRKAEATQQYDSDLMMRIARNYGEANRYYESFWAYMLLMKTFPDHQYLEDFHLSAFLGALRIEKFDIMYDLGLSFIEKFPDSDRLSYVEFSMARYYLMKGDEETFLKKGDEFITKHNEEFSLSGDMVFLMATTWLKSEDYESILKTFGKYLKKYPDSGAIEGCLYWSGVAKMNSGDFESALKFFTRQTDNYPANPYTEDGMYKKGVAAFGAGDFKIASRTLEEFLQRYPESTWRGEVEFFLGDMYAGVGEEEQAMAHYMNVEKFTKNKFFIDKAYMQAAVLKNTLEKFGEVHPIMDTYLARYPDGLASEAFFNKAQASEKMGLPADALEFYIHAIDKYGSNPKDDCVDRIILDFKRLYDENKVKTSETIKFIERSIADKQFLADIIEKPAFRYRYFQANPNTDKIIYNRIKREPNFALTLFKDPSALKNLLKQYKDQLAKYPESTEKVFSSMLQKARDAKDITLANRLMMGLDAIGKPVEVNKMFTDADLEKSSVRTLVWIGKINEKYGADNARKAYNMASARDEAEYLIDVLFAEAALEETVSNWDKVMEIYSYIERNFPSDRRAAKAAVAQGDTLMKLGDKKKATQKYEEVLQTPVWRDDAFAETLYKLGDLYSSEKQLDNALMMYERCYLGFSNAYDWKGKAVLKATKLMLANNKKEDAIMICDEFLNDSNNKKSPEFSEIELYRKSM